MSNSISEEEYNSLDTILKKNYIKEWSCVCNECKHKWHYLDDVEKKIRSQETGNALMGVGFCVFNKYFALILRQCLIEFIIC